MIISTIILTMISIISIINMCIITLAITVTIATTFAITTRYSEACASWPGAWGQSSEPR